MKELVKGNLATNPEAKIDKNGKQFVKFVMYENQYKRNESGEMKVSGKTAYLVTAYNENAKKLAESLVKGEFVEIVGAHTAQTNGQYTNHYLKMAYGRSLRKPAAKITEAPTADVTAA